MSASSIEEKVRKGDDYYSQGQEFFFVQDMKNAVRCFKKASKYGNSQSMFALGLIFYKGIGTKQSYKLSLKYYEKAALEGHVSSMNEAGVMYEHGLGTKVNFNRALYWFRRTTKHDDSDGMCNLGVMYHFGLGVEVNYEEAAYWFKRASDKGHLAATNSLAFSLETGRGCEKDICASFELYKKVAEKESFAMINLGRCFEFGIGTKKDKKLAEEWYQKAMKTAPLDHLMQIASYYLQGSVLIKRDYKKAIRFYEKAVEKGQKSAINQIREIKNYLVLDKNFQMFKPTRTKIILKDIIVVCKN